MPLTFVEAVSYLDSFINYERQPQVSYTRERFNLEEFERFLARLDDPHRRLRIVLIAGTKGKGSTAAMVASMAQSCGLQVGLYTSPHLCSIRERIRVNGTMISEPGFADLIAELMPHIEAAGLSEARRFRTFFEILTAMALVHFRQVGVDLAVLEVGVGGRLDATNVVTPLVSVITSVSIDHTDLLGSTLAMIAREKAGIIKPRGVAVVAPQRPEAFTAIQDIAAAQGARLIDIHRGTRWQPFDLTSTGSAFRLETPVRTYERLEIPLAGVHQIANAATAVVTAEQLEAQGLPMTAAGVTLGLKRVHWEGRLETVSRHPWIVLDGAHNRDSARCVRETLETCFRYRRLVLVLGISANKDLEGIVSELMPLAAVTVVTKATVSRAAPPRLVAELAARWNAQILIEEDTQKALVRAIAVTQSGDVLLVTGSLYLVGDAKRLLPSLLDPTAPGATTQVRA